MIKVEVKGMKKALSDINKYSKEVQQRVIHELNTTKQKVRNDAIRFAPVNKRTGEGGQLRRFIVAEPVKNYETSVVSRAKYSIFVEYGTGYHGQNPAGGHTTKKRWVYFDELSGEFRIGRPQRPQPFMFPAAEANREDHRRRMIAALQGKTASGSGNTPSGSGNSPSGSGMVWVNTGSKIYHSEGSQHYGSTQEGRYMTAQEAKQLGFRAASR